MSIEEGTPLISEEVQTSTPSESSGRRNLVVALSLMAIAAVGALAYSYQPSVAHGPFPGFAGRPETSNLSIKPMRLDDSGSASNKGAVTTNKAETVSIVQEGMGPFDYLSGLSTMQAIYPLLDSEDVDSKYSIKVDFDKMKVYKVKLSPEGKVKQSVDLGTMKGLSAEANFIAVDGEYCTAEKGPFHSRVSVICGREFELRELEQKDPCWFVIKVAHPDQCVKTVKSIGGWEARYAAEQRVDAVYAESV